MRKRRGGTYWRSGDYNLICDYSGFKIKRSQAKMTWDGYLVHKDFWEPRQPQDFVRGVVDKIAVPVARSESEDVFLEDNEVKASDL